MINVYLTDEERSNLIKETNDMVSECDELSMDIMCLKERLSRFSLIRNSECKRLYNSIEKIIRIKSKRLLCLEEKIDINKEILGLKKTIKKNKTL